MKKTKSMLKWGAGTLAATALIFGTMSAPAQAMDTGWGASVQSGGIHFMDTGWGG